MLWRTRSARTHEDQVLVDPRPICNDDTRHAVSANGRYRYRVAQRSRQHVMAPGVVQPMLAITS